MSSDETKKAASADAETVTSTETDAVDSTDQAEQRESAQQVKTFTQDEVNDLIAREKAKAARSAERRVRKELEAQPEQAPTRTAAEAKKPEPVAAPSEGKALAEVQRLRDDLQFAEAFGELGMKLNKDQKEVLRLKFDPNEPEALADTARRLFQVGEPAPIQRKTQPQNAEQTEAAPAPAGDGAPEHVKRARYESPGAPAASTEYARDPRDLLKWSKDDYARARENGEHWKAITTFRNSLPGGNPLGLFNKRNRALEK